MEIELKEILLQLVNRRGWDWIDKVYSQIESEKVNANKYNSYSHFEVDINRSFGIVRQDIIKDMEIVFLIANEAKEQFDFFNRLNVFIEEVQKFPIKINRISNEIFDNSMTLFNSTEFENKELSCQLLVPFVVDRIKALRTIFLIESAKHFFIDLCWSSSINISVNESFNLIFPHITYNSELESYELEKVSPRNVKDIYDYFFGFINYTSYYLKVYNKNIYLNIDFIDSE